MNEQYIPASTDLFAEEPVVYAGFWERFGAAFIDGIILWVIGFLVGLGFKAEPYEFGVSNLISLIVNWLYFVSQESGPNQATLGKKALGIKVTDLNGRRISFAQATGRALVKYLPIPFMVIGIFTGQVILFTAISIVLMLFFHLMMLWDEKSQAFHDKLAGTLVTKSKD